MSAVRWDVPDGTSLAELLDAPLPMGLRAGPTRLTFHRDLYFDTPELGKRFAATNIIPVLKDAGLLPT